MAIPFLRGAAVFALTALICSANQYTFAQFDKSSQSLSLQSDIKTSKLPPRVALRIQYAFNSASASVQTLNQSQSQADPSFSESVGEAISVFKSAADKLNDGDKLNDKDAERLSAAAEDLRTKADWSKSGGQRDPSIKVTVLTKDQDGKPVADCEVWYVTAFYYGVAEHSIKFNRLSTPTSEPLLVGTYVMWTLKNGKTGTPKPVNVGANRADSSHAGEVTVDLPAPR